MLHTRGLTCIAVLTLLGVIPRVLTHGYDNHGAATTGMEPLNRSCMSTRANVTAGSPQSYFAYPENGALVLAHSGLMIVAWFFIFPIGECILRAMAVRSAD